MPGFADGHWWVQDAAAAIPVQVLGNVMGLKALDLCAAPGGKTMQLAAGGAEVTALDVSDNRMTRVAENLTRVGLSAKTIVSDAFAYDQGGYDVVLLDAPCSATGTIRRHPDLPYAKDRYRHETARLYGVLDRQLAQHEYVAGDFYSIADMAIWGWASLWEGQQQDLTNKPHMAQWLDKVGARGGVQRGRALAAEKRGDLRTNSAAQKVLFSKPT